MFKSLKTARAAGYRAGRSGAASTAFPQSLGFLRRWYWHDGWYKGMNERLGYWLQSRKITERV